MNGGAASASSAAPVVVIGGGFVGLCSALQLQRRGRDVVLIDPGEIERAASYGNAGQFALGEVVPISGPGTLRAVRPIRRGPRPPC